MENNTRDSLISRQAAIDALERKKDKNAKGDIGGFYNKIIQNDIDTLMQLPSAPLNVPDTNVGDIISRQAAIDAVNGMPDCPNGYSDTYDKRQIIAVLEELPSAQPEQPDIIACGDCKYWICHDRRCGFWNHSVKPLDWCSYAKRREG